jgi:hypothetical protein
MIAGATSKQPDAGLPDDPTDDDPRDHKDQQQRGHEDEMRLHIAKLRPVCRGKEDLAELLDRPFPFGTVCGTVPAGPRPGWERTTGFSATLCQVPEVVGGSRG